MAFPRSGDRPRDRKTRFRVQGSGKYIFVSFAYFFYAQTRWWCISLESPFYSLFSGHQTPGPVIVRFGPQLCRICCRSCSNWSVDRCYDAGDGFDPLELSIGVRDRPESLVCRPVLHSFVAWLKHILYNLGFFENL